MAVSFNSEDDDFIIGGCYFYNGIYIKKTIEYRYCECPKRELKVIDEEEKV